jgi:hypothetical protein
MAIDIESTAASEAAFRTSNRPHSDRALPTMRAALRTSVLKLAVVLFAAAIFLIFVGTLAQTGRTCGKSCRSISVRGSAGSTWRRSSRRPGFPISQREGAMRGMIAITVILATGLGTMACVLRKDRSLGWMIAGWTIFTLGAATAVQTLVLGAFCFPAGPRSGR